MKGFAPALKNNRNMKRRGAEVDLNSAASLPFRQYCGIIMMICQEWSMPECSALLSLASSDRRIFSPARGVVFHEDERKGGTGVSPVEDHGQDALATRGKVPAVQTVPRYML